MGVKKMAGMGVTEIGLSRNYAAPVPRNALMPDFHNLVANDMLFRPACI